MKRIAIVYLPCYAGHFITQLLTLDEKTIPTSFNEIGIKERLKHYNWKNTRKFQHYSSFNQIYNNTWKSAEEFFDFEKLGCNIHIFNTHPQYYLQVPESNINLLCCLSYDDFSNCWLQESKKSFGANWPPLPSEFDIDCLKKFNENHKPFKISVDKFLYNEKWYDEYTKICDFLKIAIHKNEATELWSSWYEFRVKNAHKKFLRLSNEQKKEYYKIRLKEEKFYIF